MAAGRGLYALKQSRFPQIVTNPAQFDPETEGRGLPAAPIRRIVLTGFMGSGKTTVGPLVAARLGWRFIDVDDVIVAETGMAITEFFARHGEAAFRERERATIARLADEDGLVLALGGGAIEHSATRDLLLTTAGTAPRSPGSGTCHNAGPLPRHRKHAPDPG